MGTNFVLSGYISFVTVIHTEYTVQGYHAVNHLHVLNTEDGRGYQLNTDFISALLLILYTCLCVAD